MGKLRVIVSCLLHIFIQTVASQSIQLLNLTSTNYNLTSTCLSVSNQLVTCNRTLTGLGGSGLNGILVYSDDMLAGLCTSSCSSSLSNWVRRIEGACPGQTIPMGDGTSWYIARIGETFQELYQQACIQDKSGNFCNAIYGSAAGIDPVNQNVTRAPASTIACNSCFLSIISTQLEMPLASAVGISSIYSSLTSSCQVPNMSITPIPTTSTWTVPVTSSSTSAQATCSGTTYTIKSGDTCESISTSQDVSTSDLLSYNVLQAACYNFPTSGSLCIPSNRVCTPYTVKSGDTCSSIAVSLTKSGTPTSYAQIVSWNPAVGAGCQNLYNMIGMVICVSTPGGSSGPSPTTTTSTSTLSFNISWTPFSLLPTFTGVANASNGLNVTIIPYASGTRDDCARYITAPFTSNYSTNTTSSLCADAAVQFGVNLTDFLSWNPSLDNSTDSNCTLQQGYEYCARTYDVQNNATQYCTEWEITQPGLGCQQFANLYGVEVDQFVLWNPDVGSDCGNFTMGVQYCIAVNGFRQAGIVSTCNEYATANNTNWVDLPCQILETKFGLSHARFVAWNPAVQQNCTGIYPYYDYCVSIPGYKPTYTSTTARALSTDTGILEGTVTTTGSGPSTTSSG
ncbi:hypothetical protein F4677DRAFT_118218 [Hypoxylon crocopeplum]|nr:hypothetical protein F4677DRAFT_118218 [Hypoxylon crocopeplum]